MTWPRNTNRNPARSPGSVAHPSQACTHGLEFIEQLQHQRRTGGVDTEIALEAQRAVHPAHADAPETPVGRIASERLEIVRNDLAIERDANGIAVPLAIEALD